MVNGFCTTKVTALNVVNCFKEVLTFFTVKREVYSGRELSGEQAHS